jgi:hypothetical protein
MERVGGKEFADSLRQMIDADHEGGDDKLGLFVRRLENDHAQTLRRYIPVVK